MQVVDCGYTRIIRYARMPVMFLVGRGDVAWWVISHGRLLWLRGAKHAILGVVHL